MGEYRSMSKIIVSLTSYPERMEKMPRVIAALNKQTIKPDKIVIYLAEEEFIGYENLVDQKFFEENNTVIRWVKDNYRSYKKFIYAFKEFKDDIVITVDDDIEYAETMIEDLITGAKKFPDAVIARCVRLITSTDDDKIEIYEHWHSVVGEQIGLFADSPRFDLIALGVGGILYRPKKFSDEILRTDLFKTVCPDTDDLWLKLHQVLANVPVVLVNHLNDDTEIKEISRNGLYLNKNKSGGNQLSINNIIKYCEDKGITIKQINDILFSSGRIYKSELEKIVGAYICGRNYEVIRKKIIENSLTIDNLIKLVKFCEYIYIYGLGIYGKKLFQFIFNIDENKKVMFFETAVENEKENLDINVLPGKSLSERLQEGSAIILAGSIWNSYSMANYLEKIGIKHYYFLGQRTREYLFQNFKINGELD